MNNLPTGEQPPRRHLKDIPNQLTPNVMPYNTFNSYAGHVSSARNIMHTTHLGQTLPLDGATPERTQSGVSRDFGQYTFVWRCQAMA
jgi:hypothetical protein